MTKETVELDEVLQQFNYAETITREIGDLTVELAEAHARRNPEFGAGVMAIARRTRDEGEIKGTAYEDLEIDLFCQTLLKSWNMVKDGKPVSVGEEAAELLKASRAGRNLFREMGAFAAAPMLFKGPSKKKPPSGTTRKPSRSAKSPKASSSRATPGKGRSRSKSSAT